MMGTLIMIPIAIIRRAKEEVGSIWGRSAGSFPEQRLVIEPKEEDSKYLKLSKNILPNEYFSFNCLYCASCSKNLEKLLLFGLRRANCKIIKVINFLEN